MQYSNNLRIDLPIYMYMITTSISPQPALAFGSVAKGTGEVSTAPGASRRRLDRRCSVAVLAWEDAQVMGKTMEKWLKNHETSRFHLENYGKL